MNVKIFVFVIVCIQSINSTQKIYSSKVKVVSESYFKPPIVTHLIESNNNIRSLIICSALCSSHSICRTADYNSSSKVCRLFETISSMGMYLYDPTTSILAFNYCSNDTQIEPAYVCTRSGTFTVQQIFNSLSSAPNMTLALTDRGAYANVYGVYTSSFNGSISFITYNGVIRSLVNLSSEVSNIYSSGSNGLAIVQFYINSSSIYNNIGSSNEPELASILNISLPGLPYSCLTTSTYLYIAYVNSNPIMTIHNIHTGLILYSTNQTSVLYRPVLSQWNDTIFIIDECRVTEYTLTGIYKGNWTYLYGYQSTVRNFIHHDYAGRIYTCNSIGTNSGIYAFLQNGTKIGNGPVNCLRAFQFYLTKDQAILINISPIGSLMQIINF